MYKTIDICAGIGGIRRGFELTGKVRNVLSAENDKYACKTYKHLYNEDPTNDITTPEFKSLVLETEYDIMLAGFPCQAFSAVGKKEGFKDSLRGTIFFHIAEIIESTRPKAFLLENVEGLITHKKGETFKTIIDTLANKLNYHIIGIGKQTDLNGNIVVDNFNKNDIVLNAKNFGLPQNRPRVYIVGFDKQRYNGKLKNIKFTKLPQKRDDIIYNDLNDILDFNVDAKYYLSQGYLDTLKKHKAKQGAKGNGFGYKIVNEIGIKNPISNAILATGGSGKERNLVYDPQEEIAGKTVKGKKTPINNEGVRLMKPEEWAKLQGFLGYGFIGNKEDKFSFPENISNTQKYKQLGNSVAIPVIEEIAKEIIKTLDELEGENDTVEI
ncbi:MAG: DNA (cytosine-5-)-methyltransferase [Methanobrevibacter sp.]|jgi:DNA (cytosine-5)-methyltransferase 1|nr:DNA (cytosine-5-)-methyltransferase [Candidatus Methanoflexus mossambicus]